MGVAEFLEKQILWWILMKAWLRACRLAGSFLPILHRDHCYPACLPDRQV
jgi:hypothetical protein